MHGVKSHSLHAYSTCSLRWRWVVAAYDWRLPLGAGATALVPAGPTVLLGPATTHTIGALYTIEAPRQQGLRENSGLITHTIGASYTPYLGALCQRAAVA
jgi:hypothetical protein